ncbi:MAG TPA: hypothetical protein VGJ51_07990, partial [Candidatus Angelobacter sp.]
LTNFKSIGYRDARGFARDEMIQDAAFPVRQGHHFGVSLNPTPAQGHWRANPSFISETWGCN